MSVSQVLWMDDGWAIFGHCGVCFRRRVDLLWAAVEPYKDWRNVRVHTYIDRWEVDIFNSLLIGISLGKLLCGDSDRQLY